MGSVEPKPPSYAPVATGARAIIRHVDDFGPIHNLDSLTDLTAALSAIAPTAKKVSPASTSEGLPPCLPLLTPDGS